jgi:hypothetical protein
MTELIEPDGMCFRLRMPEGPDHAHVLRSVELLGTKVLPQLRSTS